MAGGQEELRQRHPPVGRHPQDGGDRGMPLPVRPELDADPLAERADDVEAGADGSTP